MLIGTASAKFIKDIPLTGKIKISASLADDIKVYEHKAERQDDGSYILGEDTTESNEYELMPGVDVPKDPTVKIKGYSGMPAYVYIKVESTLPDTVSYQIDETIWTTLGNGLYYRSLTAADKTESGIIEYKILKQIANGNELQVSDRLARETNASLDFTAYIAQRTAESASVEDAAAVFTKITTD
ncbi:MAG: hypothetical protein J5879_06590 [Clostridia bacterium]|nr:hypothetical protein [Clostridia bacterium]